MKRILLSVEYDGTAYAGWQRQINGLTVQQVLEETLIHACGHPVTVTGWPQAEARASSSTCWTARPLICRCQPA